MDSARHIRNEPELIEISCPLCGGRTPDLLMERNIRDLDKGFDYLSESGGHFDINRCAACGFVYSSPVFSEGTLEKLYGEASVDSCLTPSTERGTEINARRYVERLLNHSGIRRGNLLDVGCGCGQVLRAAADTGLTPYGVDPSGSAVSAVSSCGINTVHGLYTRDIFPENHFDLITLIHVIDHVMSPLDLLQTIHWHLKPGGHVLITTHNIESLLAKIMGTSFIAYNIQHISYYTPDTLDTMLVKGGLTPVKRMKSLTTYSLDHLTKNGIVNQKTRDGVLRCLSALGIGNLHLSFPFGNIEAIATKQAPSDRNNTALRTASNPDASDQPTPLRTPATP